MMTRRPGGWKTRRPYIVWSYDYSHASAGPKALHRLCHELNEAGQEAYIGPGWAKNPEWNTPAWLGALPPEEWIAVYPEVVSGNPWQVARVARWALNVPGLLAGDKVYDSAEMVFTWDRVYLDGVPVLQTPTVDLDIYADRHQPRSGALTFANKGQPAVRISGATEISLGMRLDRYALADALNHAEILYSLDDHTGMIQLARLCGCPVVLVTTGERLEPAGFREEYLALAAAFPAQLAEFIRITQAVA